MPASLRRPPPTVTLFLVLTLSSAASVAWGIWSMRTVGETTAHGVAIGAGTAVGILSLGMLYLMARTWRLALALSRGKNQIARWIVSVDDVATFVASDAARDALGPEYVNDWKPPKKIPPEGLEVVFGQDLVIVGDRYFGLVNTGMFTFEGVQILPGNPLVIEFGTVSTTGSDDIDTSRACLRIPIGRLARAEAVRVLDHYKRVDNHEIVVNPGFYLGRVRFGLIAAPICFLAAAIGYVRQEHGVDANGELNLILMIAGLLCGIGALVVAAIAVLLSREQHRRRWW